jgi:hypothetical protein
MVGLYALSSVNSVPLVFASATIFAIGICYFWPTMLGVASERFPKGGALCLGLMGTAGNLSIFFVLPLMGNIYDTQTKAFLPAGREVTALMETIEAGNAKDATPEQIQARNDARPVLEAARSQGAPMTFRKMTIAPLLLTIIFGILWMFGGYKQVHLSEGPPIAKS